MNTMILLDGTQRCAKWLPVHFQNSEENNSFKDSVGTTPNNNQAQDGVTVKCAQLISARRRTTKNKNTGNITHSNIAHSQHQ
mmetsp:Transcript_25288/g.39951  ORF Transcript_25288/g.39951 Transcript_25288/m.39951 type:complete len:82 (+) Transcript_25288:3-248(+)